MVYSRVLLELKELAVPQAGTREPLLQEHNVQGSGKTRDMGNSGERSRLEGDCYVLPGVSGHHLFQSEVLESQWYLPKPLKAESFFIVIIKITCPMSSGNTEALVSSLFLPCDGISG